MSKQIYMNAVTELNKDIKELQEAINKKKQAVNVMYESMGEQPLYEIEGEEKINNIIRADQFYGRPFAVVVAEYLKIRKQACNAQEITDGLRKGGYDFPWKTDDHLRMVAISLSKNSQSFHKLPNSTFGLLSWYPNIKKKNRSEELLDKADKLNDNSNSESENPSETIKDESSMKRTKINKEQLQKIINPEKNDES